MSHENQGLDGLAVAVAWSYLRTKFQGFPRQVFFVFLKFILSAGRFIVI